MAIHRINNYQELKNERLARTLVVSERPSLILAQDKIGAQLETWRQYLRYMKIGDDDIDKVACLLENSIKQEDEEKNKSEALPETAEPNTRTPPLDSILVYPAPNEATTRDGPPTGSSIHGVLCELTLGDEVFLTTEEAPRHLSSDWRGPFITVRPGEFAVLTTYEIVYLPTELMGLISMRNTYKQKGLISVSGFHVDPGFRGRIVFTAFNAGPRDIVLKYRERLFMIAFAEICGEAKRYWQLQMGIPTERISDLHGKSVSLSVLSERLDRMQWLLTVVLAPLAVGLIVALISLIFRK